MMRYFILVIFILTFVIVAKSQTFNVSEIDSRSYPIVSANFSAFNQLGEYYKNLTKEEFRVIDNGMEVSPDLINLECTTNLPVNVVMVLDRSGSMNEKYDNETLWQWVIQGARTFIETFPFSDSSKIAITTFSGASFMVCPFSMDKDELLDSLKKIPAPNGATNFNEPFFNEISGALNLLKTMPAHHRRAIVFLSDGSHDSGAPLRNNDILTGLNSLNIRFFGITLMYEKSPDLDFWSQNTAGKSVYVQSKQALNDIYRTFAEDLKMTVQCRIEWKSPDICDISETFRKAEIIFTTQGLKAIRNYKTEDFKIVYIESDEQFYTFGDPPLGQPVEKEIVITPRTSPFTVRDIRVVPNVYFEIIDYGSGPGNIPTYPFVIQKDTERKIKVRFTAASVRKLRQATLMINGEPCPLEVPLIGGFRQVIIDSPVDAKVYSRCDSIEIIWSGVPANTQVDLHYSTDGGNHWTVIKEKATGNSLIWFPGFTSENLRLRAKVSDQFSYDYVRSYGGTGDEFVTSIGIQNNGMYHYASGYFSKKLNIGSFSADEIGKEDFFIAKFDIDGNPVWVNTGGSRDHNDRANGITLDVRGFSYLTGFTYHGVRYGREIAPSLEMTNSKYLFLTKYSPAGQYINSTFLGASIEFSDFQAEGLKIKTIYKLGEQTKIAIIGKYSGYYVDYRVNKALPIPSRNSDSLFTAIYDEHLNLLDIYPGVTDNVGYSDLVAIHPFTQTRYNSGNFNDNTTVQGVQFSSQGLSDFWISKYARSPISQDITEVFEVVRPSSVFEINEFDFGPVVLGDESKNTLEAVVINNGKLPYTITRYTIRNASGGFMPDFTLVDDITGTILQPGETLDLNLSFKPGDLNLREAVLTIYGDCAPDIKMSLKGNGVCGGTALEIYDFGELNLNKQKVDTLFCVFENLSEATVYINPQIRGVHFADFQRILPDYVKAKEVNGRIGVAPRECIDIIVLFEPKSLGLREAEINFFVQAPCKNSITKLYGTGITSDVGITSYDWKERRVRGKYPAEVEIVNNSNVPEIVQNIQFENGNTENAFFFERPTQVPFSIPANGRVKINVEFRPSEEKDYSEHILVFLNSREEPIVSYLDGTGILPKLRATVSCGEQVNVGESTLGGITIENPSTSSVLTINSVEIENDDEFVFAVGTKTTDLIVEKNSSITLPVIFSPYAGGDNADNFIIFADDYDGTFEDLWKQTDVPIICDGIDVDITNPVDFGNLLLCTERALPITITNKSKDTDILLNLEEMALVGSNIDNFILPVLSNVVIKGGQSYSFEVKFSPEEQGNYFAELQIPNSTGKLFKIDLTGKGVAVEIESNVKEVTYMTGDKFSYSVSGNLPATYSGRISNIKITFSMDPSVVSIMKTTLKPGTNIGNEFQWGELVSLGNGYYEIIGTGFLLDNRIIELMNFEIQTLLNEKHRTLLTAEVDYGCAKELFELTIINTDQVCLNDVRVIQTNTSGHKFNLTAPVPNPAGESFILNYGIGFDVETKIEIINYYGETVRVIKDGKIRSGSYSETISTKELSSGAYMVKIISGPFVETKPLLIVK